MRIHRNVIHPRFGNFIVLGTGCRGLSVSAILAVAAPAAAGMNVTLMVQFARAATLLPQVLV